VSGATAIRRIQSAAKRREKAATPRRGVRQRPTYAATASRRRLRASRSVGSLRRPVFPARAFTTYWRSDLRHSGVEVPFGRARDL